eukprot:snap_masked-scaffold_12-processed-gene-1.41-mRNA-1 protein AED:1.00 eAED:1.00 QI:0/-1/0/0/-1/1/1/0/383
MKELIHTFSKENGKIISTLALKEVQDPNVESLKEDEVLVKILAQPINPTDVLSFNPPGGSMQYKQGKNSISQEMLPVVTSMYNSKVGTSTSIGSEACGKVVATGSNAKELQGKIVSFFPAPLPGLGQKKIVHKLELLVHNDGVNVRHAATALVNPLTVVSFLEKAKADGHSAMVHTAAASNLGKILIRYCVKENFPLVCVVRKDAQVKELQELGAEYVLNSKSPEFKKELFEALLKTKATCCFDAIGGGTLGSEILTEINKAIIANMTEQEKAIAGKYGPVVKKSLYVYGGLDPSAIVIDRSVGMTYSIEGFLLIPWFLSLTPEQKVTEFRKIADNISTVFRSECGVELEFEEFLKIENYKKCVEQKTNGKVLLLPNGLEALN